MIRYFLLLFCVVLFGCTNQSTVPTQPVSQTRDGESPAESVAGDSNVGDSANVAENLNVAETPIVVKNPNAVAIAQAEYPNRTPLDAVRNFLEGVADDNVAQAQSALVLDNKVQEYMLANIAAVRAMADFARVDSEHFGQEGAMDFELLRASLINVDKAKTVMIDADHAECTVKPPVPMKLVKQADGWKVDLTGPESKQLLGMAPPTYRATAKVFDQVRMGIVSGTIATRKAARQEMGKLKAEYGL